MSSSPSFRSDRRERVLSEAKALLFSSVDCEANLALAGRLAVPALADGCVVHIRDPGGVPRMLAAYHTDEAGQTALQELHRGRSEEGPWDVFQSGKPELLSDAGAHYLARFSDPEKRQLFERLELGSTVSAPMIFHQRPLGAITLFTSRYRRRLTERDLALVQDLSQCAAAAVALCALVSGVGEARARERGAPDHIRAQSPEPARFGSYLARAAPLRGTRFRR